MNLAISPELIPFGVCTRSAWFCKWISLVTILASLLRSPTGLSLVGLFGGNADYFVGCLGVKSCVGDIMASLTCLEYSFISFWFCSMNLCRCFSTANSSFDSKESALPALPKTLLYWLDLRFNELLSSFERWSKLGAAWPSPGGVTGFPGFIRFNWLVTPPGESLYILVPSWGRSWPSFGLSCVFYGILWLDWYSSSWF